MRAATITAISRPRTPTAQEQKKMHIQHQKEHNPKWGKPTENSTDGETHKSRDLHTLHRPLTNRKFTCRRHFEDEEWIGNVGTAGRVVAHTHTNIWISTGYHVCNRLFFFVTTSYNFWHYSMAAWFCWWLISIWLITVVCKETVQLHWISKKESTLKIELYCITQCLLFVR